MLRVHWHVILGYQIKRHPLESLFDLWRPPNLILTKEPKCPSNENLKWWHLIWHTKLKHPIGESFQDHPSVFQRTRWHLIWHTKLKHPIGESFQDHPSVFQRTRWHLIWDTKLKHPVGGSFQDHPSVFQRTRWHLIWHTKLQHPIGEHFQPFKTTQVTCNFFNHLQLLLSSWYCDHQK
jgi:hypothetical protein